MLPIIANFGMFENPFALLILAGVVVLLFGTSKLAGFGKSLGEGLREFKKATRDDEPDKKDEAEKPAKPTDKES